MKKEIELLKNLRGVLAATGAVTMALALDTAIECMERVEKPYTKDDIVESHLQMNEEFKGCSNGK